MTSQRRSWLMSKINRSTHTKPPMCIVPTSFKIGLWSCSVNLDSYLRSMGVTATNIKKKKKRGRERERERNFVRKIAWTGWRRRSPWTSVQIRIGYPNACNPQTPWPNLLSCPNCYKTSAREPRACSLLTIEFSRPKSNVSAQST